MRKTPGPMADAISQNLPILLLHLRSALLSSYYLGSTGLSLVSNSCSS